MIFNRVRELKDAGRRIQDAGKTGVGEWEKGAKGEGEMDDARHRTHDTRIEY